MKKFLISIALITFIGVGVNAACSNIETRPNMSYVDSSSDVDDMLDSYEKYVNNYIRLLKKSQEGDMSALAEYSKMLKQAQDLQKKIEKCKGEMDSKQLARYSKITMKMANALND